MKKYFSDTQHTVIVQALTPNEKLTADQIEKFLKEFGKRKLHNEIVKTINCEPAKVSLIGSLQTDAKRGIAAPMTFSNCPVGTWFVFLWIQDKTVYDNLKKTNGKEIESAIETFFQTKLSPNINMKPTTKTPLADAFAALAGVRKSKSGKIADGSVLLWNGELKQGTEILVEIDQGKADPLPVPEGVYTFENGMQIEVDTVSKVTRVSENQTKQNSKFGSLPVWKYVKFKKQPALILKDDKAWRDRYMKP